MSPVSCARCSAGGSSIRIRRQRTSSTAKVGLGGLLFYSNMRIMFIIITFTDPLTCSFLILSFFVTPHIPLSILISFTSSLLSWPNGCCPCICTYTPMMLALPLFCHTTLHSNSSNFPMLHSPYILFSYSCLGSSIPLSPGN